MFTHSDHVFFRPMWRRVLAIVFCTGWTILEWVSNEPIWAVIAAGITLYCFWNFFYIFDKKEDSSND